MYQKTLHHIVTICLNKQMSAAKRAHEIASKYRETRETTVLAFRIKLEEKIIDQVNFAANCGRYSVFLKLTPRGLETEDGLLVFSILETSIAVPINSLTRNEIEQSAYYVEDKLKNFENGFSVKTCCEGAHFSILVEW
jgi:hypothetical protein